MKNLITLRVVLGAGGMLCQLRQLAIYNNGPKLKHLWELHHGLNVRRQTKADTSVVIQCGLCCGLQCFNLRKFSLNKVCCKQVPLEYSATKTLCLMKSCLLQKKFARKFCQGDLKKTKKGDSCNSNDVYHVYSKLKQRGACCVHHIICWIWIHWYQPRRIFIHAFLFRG